MIPSTGPRRLALTLLLSAAATAFAVDQAGLEFQHLEGPGFSAARVEARLDLAAGRVDFRAREVEVFGRRYPEASLECGRFELRRGNFSCAGGRLLVPGLPALALDLRWRGGDRTLTGTLLGGAGGPVRFALGAEPGGWQASLDLEDADLAPWAGFLPGAIPPVSAGRARGRLEVHGDTDGVRTALADLTLAALAFGDADGRRAGEALAGRLWLSAQREGRGWRYGAGVDWTGGEAYFDPFYLRAGHSVSARGVYADGRLAVEDGAVRLAGVGEIGFSGLLRDTTLGDFSVSGRGLDVKGLYALVLKPVLAGTAAADLEAEGRLDLALEGRAGRPVTAEVALRDIHVEDLGRRFALYGVQARIPWSANEARPAFLEASGGYVLKLTLGGFRADGRVQPGGFTIPALRMPLLGGALNLNRLTAVKAEEGWNWSFSGGLEPVSMQSLAHGLGWPPMQGSVSGELPRVRYRDRRIELDGELKVKVFDGLATVRGMSLDEPLSVASRLRAEIAVERVDLALLTSAFSFGRMEGRVDLSVKDLELVNWKPVRFDARLASSPGDYRRRISQQAVDNISALGGAGAAAALQRTFLRFFEEFGYQRLALSCALANGVCRMDGVEPAPGGYVIVKGGGIPAITVVGYNRNVNWNELVARLSRVTRGESSPVVR